MMTSLRPDYRVKARARRCTGGARVVQASMQLGVGVGVATLAQYLPAGV